MKMKEIDSLFPKKRRIGRGEKKEMTDVLFKMYAEGHVSANEAAGKLNMSEATFQKKFEASAFFQGKTVRRKTNAR